MIEHINEPIRLIEKIDSMSSKGTHLFMSTINRNLKSFIFAKIMAEYVFRIVPLGTHQYSKFLPTPYELDTLLGTKGFELKSIDGISFNPISESFSISKNPDINYFIHAQNNQKIKSVLFDLDGTLADTSQEYV